MTQVKIAVALAVCIGFMGTVLVAPAESSHRNPTALCSLLTQWNNNPNGNQTALRTQIAHWHTQPPNTYNTGPVPFLAAIAPPCDCWSLFVDFIKSTGTPEPQHNLPIGCHQ